MAQTPQLDPGEKLEKLQFPAVTMQLKGWTKFGNSHVYTLPVRAGQHMKISFSSKSKFAFLAIFDLSKPDDEAFFGTDEDGMSFETTVKENATAAASLLFQGLAAPWPRRSLQHPDRAVGGCPATAETADRAGAPVAVSEGARQAMR